MPDVPTAVTDAAPDERACPFCAETIKAAAVRSGFSPISIAMIAVAVIAGGILLLGAFNSPEDLARRDAERAIKNCRGNSSMDAYTRSVTCFALEQQYIDKYGRSP